MECSGVLFILVLSPETTNSPAASCAIVGDLKQPPQRQFHLRASSTHPRHHLRGQQRISPNGEKIIVYPDLCLLQRLFRYLHQLSLFLRSPPGCIPSLPPFSSSLRLQRLFY